MVLSLTKYSILIVNMGTNKRLACTNLSEKSSCNKILIETRFCREDNFEIWSVDEIKIEFILKNLSVFCLFEWMIFYIENGMWNLLLDSQHDPVTSLSSNVVLLVLHIYLAVYACFLAYIVEHLCLYFVFCVIFIHRRYSRPEFVQINTINEWFIASSVYCYTVISG